MDNQGTELFMLLQYFSIFQHPLKAEELYRFASSEYGREAISKGLDKMVAEGITEERNGFFFLPGGEQHIAKRLAGEQKASELLPKARKAGRFIAKFPGVRFVGISGSLSKGYANEKTDFDFFIVTAANMLWVCRSLLHLFKKLTFLVNRQHHFCMNYFVDEEHLELEEQNLFTRIELSTLIPVYNPELYALLLFQNRHNLPNLKHLPDYDEAGGESLWEKRHLEGEKHRNKWLVPLNLALMKLTDRKWKRKWERKNYPMEDYALAFKTTPFVSKNHPMNYQKKVLAQLSKIKV